VSFSGSGAVFVTRSSSWVLKPNDPYVTRYDVGIETNERDLDERVAAVAALVDPLRRALYRFVAGQDHAVGRNEAAQAIGVARSVAAFHLDRLVAEGLLETEYRRLGERRGPGAGRPSKLYRPAAGDTVVSVPPRQYQLAADLLASAVSEATETGGDPADVLRRVAHQRGRERAGRAARAVEGSTDALAAVADALTREGYEPVVGEGEIVLANCPFHALVQAHTHLVCTMNLALLEGFVDALPEANLVARLEPTPGRCCVRLHFDPSARKEQLR
jgi:predicted ArsR family transcriptional regulator